ncbi:MAG: ABC transporter ATP-binding protein [Firmicutes bacterium]|nr:ABC transporter ATP-binding protein [Bacillota bacterium]
MTSLENTSLSTRRRPILKAERLNKVYWMGTAVYAVSNVSLEIEEGQFVVVMGPSGSGKSTLLGLLAGLDRPTSGEVFLDGQRLGALSESALAAVRLQKVGMVYQSFNLLPGLTALENVALPIRLAGAPDDFAFQHTRELLARVGLAQRQHHRPAQLSGGEQQRVAIARALANDPKVLLADEPTANLDSRTARELRSLLVALGRELHQTTVVVTHDATLAEVADRVILIADGRVVGERPGGAAA